MKTLDELRSIELHDSGLEELVIDFSSKKVSIRVSVFNDKKSDYDFIRIHFLGVEHLNTSQMSLDDLSSLEIYTHEVSVAPRTSIKIVLLTGFGGPSTELSFNFDDYTVRYE